MSSPLKENIFGEIGKRPGAGTLQIRRNVLYFPKLISQLNDRGAASKSKPGGKGSKAVAGWKGAAAEGGNLQPPPGQPENIRLTVAYAERYGLIAKLPRSPAPGGSIGAFRIFRQLRIAGCLILFRRPGAHGAQIIENKDN